MAATRVSVTNWPEGVPSKSVQESFLSADHAMSVSAGDWLNEEAQDSKNAAVSKKGRNMLFNILMGRTLVNRKKCFC